MPCPPSTLAWPADITSYRVKCFGDDGAAALEASSQTPVHLATPGYAWGQSYQCEAAATNSVGEGAVSAPPFNWTSPPGAPTITKVAAGALGALSVEIQHPSPNGNQGETASQAG